MRKRWKDKPFSAFELCRLCATYLPLRSCQFPKCPALLDTDHFREYEGRNTVLGFLPNVLPFGFMTG